MKRIAIITPGLLPVPAVRGGAVETLITTLIKENEINNCFLMDVFTIFDTSFPLYTFNYTNIVSVDIPQYARIADRFLDKLYRSLPGQPSCRRIIDDYIVKTFMDYRKDNAIVYDAVIIQNQMSLALKLISKLDDSELKRIKLFFHMHNDIDIYRSRKDIKRLTRYGVHFLAVSAYISRQIEDTSCAARVSVIPNGLDTDVFVHSELNTKEGEVIFLYSGRIIKEKGVLELIYAFQDLDGLSKINAKLIVVGFSEVSKRTQYERLVLQEIEKVQSNKIQYLIKLHQKQMIDLYKKVDVVCIPSRFEEPFGMVALEAMAMGKAVIATNAGALSTILDANNAIIVNRNHADWKSILVDYELIENLKSAMEKLLNKDECRKRGIELARYFSEHKEFHKEAYFNNFVKKIDINNEARIENNLVSVIVPIYNMEKYIICCLESIVAQSYSNLEIILVDDGSTDSSGFLCDDFAVGKKNVKVIHKKNGGLSDARNVGLDAATGQWLFFVDSDDWIENNLIEHLLYEAIETNSDIVCCGICKVWENDKGTRKEIITSDVYGHWDGNAAVWEMMDHNTICSVAWNKLYKRDLWIDIKFPVKHLHEDEYTIYKVLFSAKKVCFCPEIGYNYRQQNESIMHNYSIDMGYEFLNALLERAVFFNEIGENELVEHCFVKYLEYIKYQYRLLGKGNRVDRQRLIKDYKGLITREFPLRSVAWNKRVLLKVWSFIHY